VTLPHYTDRCYESCRQRRRYHTDPAYRLDRINRARKRLGLKPYRSLGSARIRLTFERCPLDVAALRRPRLGLPIPLQGTMARRRRDRLTLLRGRI
jgi:hypothetical protein